MTQNEKLDIVLSDIQYIKSMLEDNPKTGQKGVVQLSNNNKLRLDLLETNEKVRMGKVGVVGVIFGIIGANIFNIIKFFKLFI